MSMKPLLADYKRAYLAFMSALGHTQLVAAVAVHSLREFPKNLPSELAKATTQLFTRAGKALIKAAEKRSKSFSSIKLSTHRKRRPTSPKPNSTESDASSFAFQALEIMLAADITKPETLAPTHMGDQFQAVARQQAIAMTFAHLDAFFGDTLRTICRARPEVLRINKQLTWATALQFAEMQDLTEYLAEQFIYEFGWKTVSDRLATLREKLGLSVAMPADAMSLLALFEQKRHLIIHNGGIVSQRYIDDSMDASSHVGKPLVVSDEDVRDLYRTVQMLGSELFTAVAVKFLGANDGDLTRVWRFHKRDTQ